MNVRECQNFSFRFPLLIVFCGLLLFCVSCGTSKDTHLARGEEYLQKRKFHEAVMEFRSAADIDKDSANAHWGLARAYENLGQFYETLDELRKTVELAPDNEVPPQTRIVLPLENVVFQNPGRYYLRVQAGTETVETMPLYVRRVR